MGLLMLLLWLFVGALVGAVLNGKLFKLKPRVESGYSKGDVDWNFWFVIGGCAFAWPMVLIGVAMYLPVMAAYRWASK